MDNEQNPPNAASIPFGNISVIDQFAKQFLLDCKHTRQDVVGIVKKVFFVCISSDCKFKHQKYYCKYCSENHNHTNQSIEQELRKLQNKLEQLGIFTFKDEVESTFKVAVSQTDKHWKLDRYYESLIRSSPSTISQKDSQREILGSRQSQEKLVHQQRVHNQFLDFVDFHLAFMKDYNTMHEKMTKQDVVLLEELVTKLSYYTERFEQYKELTHVGLNRLWKDYGSVISVKTALPSIDFDGTDSKWQLDIEAFNEQKWQHFLDREKANNSGDQSIDFDCVMIHWALILKKAWEEFNRALHQSNFRDIIEQGYQEFLESSSRYFQKFGDEGPPSPRAFTQNKRQVKESNKIGTPGQNYVWDRNNGASMAPEPRQVVAAAALPLVIPSQRTITGWIGDFDKLLDRCLDEGASSTVEIRCITQYQRQLDSLTHQMQLVESNHQLQKTIEAKYQRKVLRDEPIHMHDVEAYAHYQSLRQRF